MTDQSSGNLALALTLIGVFVAAVSFSLGFALASFDVDSTDGGFERAANNTTTSAEPPLEPLLKTPVRAVAFLAVASGVAGYLHRRDGGA